MKNQIVYSLIGLTLLIIILSSVPALAQTTESIPTWIKNTANFWAEDKIDDATFAIALEWLIKNGLINSPELLVVDSSDSEDVINSDLQIPDWIKNNANFWVENKISDMEFINAIKYLYKEEIIKSPNIVFVPLSDEELEKESELICEDLQTKGDTEIVNSVFTKAFAGSTSKEYSNFVLLKVSGIGKSFSDSYNDAFYVFTATDGTPYDNPNNLSEHYQLILRTSNSSADYKGFIAKNSMVCDLELGKRVTAPYVPSYRTDHTYAFVVDLGNDIPYTVDFGVHDGEFFDNTGSYTIEITQIKES